MGTRIVILVVAATLSLSAAKAQTATSFTSIAGTAIIDPEDRSAGTLRDVIVGDGGRIAQILIGQGGVLGIGETMRAMDVDTLPDVADGRIRLNVPANAVSSLPEYEEPLPAQTQHGPPPISGANQMAPQSATANIPVAPSAAEPPPPAAAPTPAEMPPTQASADVAQSEAMPQPPAVLEEKSGAGSGSSGMAPQQGTGTAATQASPSANEGGGRDDGVAASNPSENMRYGREEYPDNQPMPESSSGRGSTDARAPEATADPDQARPAPAGEIAERERPRWRVGRIVGAPVLGDRDGYSVKDVLFSGTSAESAVIARTGQPDMQVPFNRLNIGGTPDDPKVAFTAPPPAAQP